MRVERDGVIHRVECTIEPVTPAPRGASAVSRLVPRPPAPCRRRGHRGRRLRRAARSPARSGKQGSPAGAADHRRAARANRPGIRAGHEELLSLNEELQSNNEELQASKEELQSLNEELLTVNRQLEERNVEFRLASGDLQNLIMSTDIPIIFLDRELRVRRFMPAATQLMRLVPRMSDARSSTSSSASTTRGAGPRRPDGPGEARPAHERSSHRRRSLVHPHRSPVSHPRGSH